MWRCQPGYLKTIDRRITDDLIFSPYTKVKKYSSRSTNLFPVECAYFLMNNWIDICKEEVVKLGVEHIRKWTKEDFPPTDIQDSPIPNRVSDIDENRISDFEETNGTSINRSDLLEDPQLVNFLSDIENYKGTVFLKWKI
eukprot:TRINITY_DN671_c0_g1_i16.p1 TRINITY_DN671_c0_g1~~TRINITY_DN671_c0_g1_i16.p1  ORF type:complete len:140 (+),score=22.67 TRINITY_DN671_c0_g1_i16:49-468(+)